jgi:hypothetical protein
MALPGNPGIAAGAVLQARAKTKHGKISHPFSILQNTPDFAG